MKAWIWGLILMFSGLLTLATLYANTGSLKSTIPALDLISAVAAIATFIGFICFVFGIRSWHK